jgi:exonuclease SbcC
MPRLTRVSIRNYQSLRRAELKLCPGVNVVVGSTDSGKSSLVRALRDWAHNAEGSDFVTRGAKGPAAVGVTLEDGARVAWAKGRKTNRYAVDGERLDKVGRGRVPGPVSERTGFRPAEFGEGVERRLQFQEQGEPAFLVGDSPSDCARVLAGLSGASEIGEAVRRAARDSQALARDSAAIARDVEEARAALARFDGLDERAAVVAGLSARLAGVEKLGAEVEAATALLAELREGRARLAEARTALRAAEGRERALSRVPTLVERSAEVEAGARLLSDLERGRRAVADARWALARARALESALAPVEDLAERSAEVGRARVLARALDEARKSVARARQVLGVAGTGVERVAGELREFVAANPVCPLCGSDMRGKVG